MEAIIPYTDVGNGNDGDVEGEDDKTMLQFYVRPRLHVTKDSA